MMGNGLIAFAAAVGAGIWVYSKTGRRGGGDFVRSITPAAMSGILVFFIALTILWAAF